MKDMIENMKCNSIEDVIGLYVEINLLHPFREGNGRTSRIWLDNALNCKFDCVVEWSRIAVDEYLIAMILSVHDDSVLKKLLLESLTTDVSDKE